MVSTVLLFICHRHFANDGGTCLAIRFKRQCGGVISLFDDGGRGFARAAYQETATTRMS
jgi:hypothetical protein